MAVRIDRAKSGRNCTASTADCTPSAAEGKSEAEAEDEEAEEDEEEGAGLSIMRRAESAVRVTCVSNSKIECKPHVRAVVYAPACRRWSIERGEGAAVAALREGRGQEGRCITLLRFAFATHLWD